jgi:hypothetical protein
MSEEKHEEKEEKNREDWWAEWWRNDQLDALGWAAIFIWGGLVLLAQATNFAANFRWWNGWPVFFTGAGAIVLVEAVIRLLIAKYRRRVLVSLIFGFILLAIGLGSWFWIVLLFVIGLIIVISTFARRH